MLDTVVDTVDARQSPIDSFESTHTEEEIESPMNFTYEKDLQTALVRQAEKLFNGYKIYGENLDGIEYTISGKRIDLLLKNHSNNSLLAIELKSGIADFKVFGQIAMYLGLLSNEFPDKKLFGLIIAGKIDDSLKNACLITDKIKLMTYKMELTLDDVI
jgi:RecB family endonuclease NucS